MKTGVIVIVMVFNATFNNISYINTVTVNNFPYFNKTNNNFSSQLIKLKWDLGI